MPSFTWGRGESLRIYKKAKAFETAERVTALVDKTFTKEDRVILDEVYKMTKKFRLKISGN